jgi:2-methylisocitrate lyase-like PEP mutase family enzyme
MSTPIAQQERARRFRALHDAGKCFVIPNPWDAGSARILAAEGFAALATTSAGAAFALGRRDGRITPAQAFASAQAIAAATDLPVSGDLENGWSAAPREVARVIERAAEAGLVGGSIEDASGDPATPIYDFGHAVERIRAAAEAARRLPFPFTLTARSENFLRGRPDLADTIRRLQAYQEAGADVLYAPGLRSEDDVAAVVAAVDRPVNVLMGDGGLGAGVERLAALGVVRVSLGSSLARAALGELVRAAREIRDEGSFGFRSRALPGGEIARVFAAFEERDGAGSSQSGDALA